MAHPVRRTLMAKIHIAKKQLCLDDDSYRGTLQLATKKNSCKDMNIEELESVVELMKSKGFKDKPASRKSKTNAGIRTTNNLGGQAGLAKAWWIALARHNVLRDKSDKALDSFVKKTTGLDSLRFVNQDKNAGNKLIETLKAWAKREGVKL